MFTLCLWSIRSDHTGAPLINVCRMILNINVTQFPESSYDYKLSICTNFVSNSIHQQNAHKYHFMIQKVFINEFMASYIVIQELMKLNLWCYVCQIFLVIFCYWNTWQMVFSHSSRQELAANSGPGALPWWPLSGANVQYFQVWCPKRDGMEGKISVTHRLAQENDNNLCF